MAGIDIDGVGCELEDNLEDAVDDSEHKIHGGEPVQS